MTSRSPSRKPTVVLVHGAFADSTSWNGVVRTLRHEGHPVVAAANPLRGLRSDAAYVGEVLAGVDGPVVLVGHSYGGSVVTAAARAADHVQALVYVAAFIPDMGESALDLAARFPGSSLGEALHPMPVTLPDGSPGVDFTIEQDLFPHQFAADVPEDVARLMAVTQRPVTGAALEEAAPEPAWRTLPSWAVVATEDLNIPPAAQRFMAERAGAHVVEVRASHAVSVSRPEDVARTVTEASSATT
ncbi:alpha/beta fold hydrolase [Streptomyces tendae]|uniref:Alpha/beta hydrolase n=1 Tax=Streptomyces tendae TaxID=1932 RepID=A0ABX5ZUU1_STRTE|nr:alpha/beta hydrolase [Streptomyces tendae]QER87942.1 alpha/beta hydrolase [Streptomyces tendae]